MTEDHPRLIEAAFPIKQAALEAEIDRAAARLWDITDDELKAIQDALREV